MRLVATPEGIEHRADMDGETYEKWLDGYDVETGVAKGRLRKDDKGVQFVEVRRLYTTVGGLRAWIGSQRLTSRPVIERPKAV